MVSGRSSLGWYLALLALLGAERLVELAISRRNAARSFARGGVERGRGHFRVMAALHALFLLSCAAEAVVARRPFLPAVGWPALAVALCAQALRYWAILSLGARWNVRVIAVAGEPPVTSGPYRWLRHPNYVAVAAEIAAVPLIHGAWATALLFSLANAALLSVRIRVEESALGEAYAREFSGRPRFWPLLRRRTGQVPGGPAEVRRG
jgi:methyltransferase